ncbi:hypothetical protein QFC19_008963 [Naganishia cerealis]|uniref:Uncharacterized protein n=1 Tax=Naganishia cerealis TaxID=610337 RepID=A0ACC2UY22_9TREE|nr:hypothetical protein QFC19_008963 [Naganishia cerealis]
MVQHGQCLCGAVKLTIKEDQKAQIACHCLDCQRASGGPYTTNVVVPDDLIEIEGKTKSYTSKADSGNMETGLFPDFKNVPFAAEIYVKDRFEALKPVEGAKQEQAMS